MQQCPIPDRTGDGTCPNTPVQGETLCHEHTEMRKVVDWVLAQMSAGESIIITDIVNDADRKMIQEIADGLKPVTTYSEE